MACQLSHDYLTQSLCQYQFIHVELLENVIYDLEDTRRFCSLYQASRTVLAQVHVTFPI
jgi:hypothetical protein